MCEKRRIVLKDQEILEEIRRTLEMEAAAVQGILRWIQDEEWVRLVRLWPVIPAGSR